MAVATISLVRPARIALVAAIAGIAVTLGVSAIPFVHFAYRSPAAHVAVDTTAGLIALLTAYLFLGRFGQRHLLGDLLMAYALGLLAVTNLVFALGTQVAGTTDPAFSTWAALTCRLIAAATFAVAAMAPDRVVRPRRAPVTLVSAIAITALVVGAAMRLLGTHLPLGIDPLVTPEAANHPRLVGSPAVLAAQAVSVVLYGLAAAGFLRRAGRSDELMGWLAAGSVLAAFARLNYLLFPSIYTEWIYTGDVLRLGFSVALLVGAGREIAAYWRGMSERALLEERRRMARDLHDGLAHELAFVTTQARHMTRNGHDPLALERMAASAERALDESRRAIAALSQNLDESLDAALAQAAEYVASRTGIDLDLDLDSPAQVPPATREALVRIVREAVINASRHGHASEVRVSLWQDRGTRLRIEDNGRGFDRAAVQSGFGLVSMTQRAAAIGATLDVTSTPGAGTAVEVVLQPAER